MRINTNVAALNTLRVLAKTDQAVGRSIGRLSSGFRINRAADDAAGLGIANQLRADLRALQQATRNAEQSNSLLQVAEGGAQQIQSILERMKELATQAASDNVDSDGRARIDTEFQEILTELDRIAASTKFQGRALLDGTFGNGVDTNPANSTLLAVGTFVGSVSISGTATDTFTVAQDAGAETLTLTNSGGTLTQVVDISGVSGVTTIAFDAFGISLTTEASFDSTADTADGDIVVTGSAAEFVVGSSGIIADDKISISGLDLTVATLGLTGSDLASDTTAETTLGLVDAAITTVSDAFSTIGAKQNRLDIALTNVRISVENFAASESVIRDADLAAEFTELTKNQILAQAGISVLAQANQSPQQILALLG